MEKTELRREELQLISQIGQRKIILICMAVLLALLAVGAGFCQWQIGDGKPTYTVNVLDKSTFPVYEAGMPTGSWVQAEVATLIHVYTESSWMEKLNGSKTVKEYQNFYEVELADGSRCMLTCEGSAERLHTEFLGTSRILSDSQIGPYEVRPHATVYGRTRLLCPMDEEHAAQLDAQEPDLFPHKPEGMTDSQYYETLLDLPVIDLDRTDATERILNEASVARLASLSRWRNALALAAGVVLLAVAVTGWSLHRKSLQFTKLIRAKRNGG